MNVLNEHSKKWLDDGIAELAPATISADFAEYLESLPWDGPNLEWARIGSAVVNLEGLSEDEQVRALAATRLGRSARIVFWFSPTEPSLVCPAEFALANFDVAFWGQPGPRYMFGAEVTSSDLAPSFSDFAEFDGSSRISVAL